MAKAPVAAWAVNQLFWSRKDDYEALIAASEDMRRTNRAVIEGKRGDLRAAGREHERALETALKATLALMKEAGQPVTDTTRHTILNTLRALPADEAAGRLTHALTPGGFEMLSGITPAKAARAKEPLPKAAPAAPAKGQTSAAREAARGRAERDAAERAIRDARSLKRRARRGMQNERNGAWRKRVRQSKKHARSWMRRKTQPGRPSRRGRRRSANHATRKVPSRQHARSCDLECCIQLHEFGRLLHPSYTEMSLC